MKTTFALVLALLASNGFAAGHELAEPPLGQSAYAQHQPLVAYAGGRYLPVWVESLQSAGSRILGDSILEIQPLGANGMTAETPRITEAIAHRGPQVSVASSPAYDAVVGLQESDAASGERAVTYAEREMFRVPQP